MFIAEVSFIFGFSGEVVAYTSATISHLLLLPFFAVQRGWKKAKMAEDKKKIESENIST